MSEGKSHSGANPSVDPMLGQVLDSRYKITRKLGEGGMGEVYAAEHIHIEKHVAIKLLRNEILTNKEAVTRFGQEARAASSIGHKNIIRIEDFGPLPDGRIYLAMELLQGQPLNDLIKQQISPERLLNILVQTGYGLAAAHKKNIVHRDMKPENVFVTVTADGEETPKLLDFGIAKVSGADGNNHLTRTGTIFGTPFYMAPEQALGQNVDHRADIYAMGVIMYEIFCGVVPFSGESFMGILTQHITSEPRNPHETAQIYGKVIPPGVAEIILRCMRKEPSERFQTMDELVAALVVVYRNIAGQGMSGYLSAQGSGVMPASGQRPGSSSQPAHTPSPGIKATVAADPQHFSGTPRVRNDSYQPPNTGHARAPSVVPQPTYPPGASGSMAGIASDSHYQMPKRSRAGLWVALLGVLVIGGAGASAYFFLGNDKDATAKTDPPRNDLAVKPEDHIKRDAGAVAVAKPPADAAVEKKPDAAVKKPDEQNTKPDKPTKPDRDKPTKPDKPVVVEPPKPEIITVLVNSKPPNVKAIVDGKPYKNTPFNLKMEKGKSISIVLKRKGFRDFETTIDGSKEEESFVLVRVERPSGGGGTTQPPDGPDSPGSDPNSGGDSGNGGTTEPPSGNNGGGSPPNEGGGKKKTACEKDPSSAECRCEKDPNLPDCQLE